MCRFLTPPQSPSLLPAEEEIEANLEVEVVEVIAENSQSPSPSIEEEIEVDVDVEIVKVIPLVVIQNNEEEEAVNANAVSEEEFGQRFSTTQNLDRDLHSSPLSPPIRETRYHTASIFTPTPYHLDVQPTLPRAPPQRNLITEGYGYNKAKTSMY
jgi:hypothetical protein